MLDFGLWLGGGLKRLRMGSWVVGLRACGFGSAVCGWRDFHLSGIGWRSYMHNCGSLGRAC